LTCETSLNVAYRYPTHKAINHSFLVWFYRRKSVNSAKVTAISVAKDKDFQSITWGSYIGHCFIDIWLSDIGKPGN